MANITHQDSAGIEPIRSRSIENSKWIPWLLAALVLFSGFGLGAFYASTVSNEDVAPIAQPIRGPDESPVAAASVQTASVPVAASLAQPAPAAGNLGPTEVAYITNFPMMEFDWESVTIPTESSFEFRWFGQLGGDYAVVGFDYSTQRDGYGITTWMSPDGRDWSKAGTMAVPEQVSLYEITGSGDRLFAMGEVIGDGRQVDRVVYSTTDGVEWTRFALPEVAEDFDYAYIQSIAANDQGIVVAMTRETYPPEPPQVLQIRGYTIEVDHRSGTYTLTDSSGTILMVGSTDDIWHWEDNGQGIYQPDTGELITTVPWEVWEQGWSSAHEGGPGGSPLPIPMEPTEPYVAPLFVVEWDGFVITLDENEGVYEIADAETGNVLYSGPIEQVWRGPSPRFVDPDTGDVVLSVSWEEWDEAESASWESYEEAYYWDGGYHTEAIVLFSPDGDQWDQTVISSSSSGASIAAMATDDKLVLNVNTYGEYGEDRSVWTSTDGVNWDVAESSDASERYLHSTVATADGMKSIGDGQGGQGIWSSRDGSTWTTDFTIGPQDDGQYVWLSALADGPLGTVAAGTREASYDYRPLTVSKDGVTAEFEGDFLVRITDDASGEELLALTWADFESGAVSDRVLYENEETSFFDAAGSLVMVITNEEAYEAFRIRDQNVESDSQQIMFIEVDGEWFEVEIDPGGTDHVSGVVVGDSEVLLGTVDWDNSYYWEEEFGGGISSVVILIGTPSE